MAADAHVARYRAFMQSPGYDRHRDLVVFDEVNGRVAAFAVHWVDDDLSLAQLEPVGTDPDYWQRGLARILLATTFEKLAGEGVVTVRVNTYDDRDAAIALYRSCGFAAVGGSRPWARR
jgi:GNAT superfamily N-acetyltransferase